jgi:hypothetical protein
MKYGETADPQTQLAAKLAKTRKDLDETAKPRGGQIYKTLEEVQSLVENLSDRVDNLISEQSYTKAQIEQRDQAVLDVANGKAPLSHTHDQTQIGGVWDKGVATSSSGQFNAGVTSVGVYNLQLTSNYKVQYVDSNGRMGFAPSTRSLKTEVGLADFTDQQVEQLVLVHYRYTAEITLAQRHNAGTVPYAFIPGYRAGVKLGLYAEDLHAAGLWEFVMYRADSTGTKAELDETGAPIPEGIRYEMLAMLLVPAVQRLIVGFRQLRHDVDEIREHLQLT